MFATYYYFGLKIKSLVPSSVTLQYCNGTAVHDVITCNVYSCGYSSSFIATEVQCHALCYVAAFTITALLFGSELL